MTRSIMLLAMGVGAAAHAAQISLKAFEITFPRDEEVRIRLQPVGEGMAVRSCGLRTSVPGHEPALAGLSPHGKYLYLDSNPEDTTPFWMILDNGAGDHAPEEGIWELRLSTERWPDGTHEFLVYADNRPGPGAYAAARRRLRIVTSKGAVDRDTSGEIQIPELVMESFSVTPSVIRPGQDVTIAADITVRHAETEALQTTLRTPYTVGPDEAPPGFRYAADSKLAFGPEPGPDGRVTLSTNAWKPGVVHLTFEASIGGWGGKAAVYRDLAVTVLPESPRLDVSIESDSYLKPGTHFDTICRLDRGAALAHGMITRDGGRTWTAAEHTIPMAQRLPDGSLLGLAMRSDPVTERDGWFVATGYRAPLNLESVETFDAELYVPKATKGVGHAPYPGPILWRSIVPMPDGSLIAAAYGWFEGDDSPVPGQKGSMRYRTYVLKSTDKGRIWRYLSTVAYDPDIGTEGYCEPVIRRLPNGDLYALLRTGGNNRPYHQDNPLCWTRSTDGGRTWSPPKRTGVEGVSPDLYVMRDGTLACSYGRPGADIMFSLDNGETWGNAYAIDPQRYSGYTALCEIEPGVLLYGYGAMDHLVDDSGNRRHELRIARIRVRTLY